MDYISTLQDSIDTSIDMKLFKNRKDSSVAHIFKSKLTKLSSSKYKDLDNFNPNRLKKSAIKAYPLSDRPRGNKDISSVKFHQKQLQQNKNIEPIWILKKNKKNILLDGAHRIVASFIEGKQYIYAYLINI
jgi:hypothetical protein